MSTADAPAAQSGRARGLLFALGVLGVVSALVASTVVVVRRPPPRPEAVASSLQVAVNAPPAVIEGDIAPVTIVAVGTESVEHLDLVVDGEIVDSLAPVPAGSDVSATFAWVVSTGGTIAVQGRAVDAAGREQLSRTTFVTSSPAPAVHVVEAPEGETIAEIAAGAGVALDRVTDTNPGVDPVEVLEPGSLVFLPPRLLSTDRPPGEDSPVSIEDGVLQFTDPPPEVFLYLRVGDSVLRVPDDPGESVPGDRRIDIRGMLPPLPGGDVSVEVWGRFGLEVKLLAELEVPASSLTAPSTRLDAIFEVGALGVSVPVGSVTATEVETVELEWSSNVPHEGVLWFLSSEKPTSATVLAPRRILQSGWAEAQELGGSFSIDLADNVFPIALPVLLSAFATGTEQEEDELFGDPIPAGSDAGLGPAWAWVIPVDGETTPIGPASDPVRIIIGEAPFDPSRAPPFDVVSLEVVIPPAPNPALTGCVRIVSQVPPFPGGVGRGVILHPDGSTSYRGTGGIKITGTLPYTFDETGRALYPFTVCPGEYGNFQWGDVGCAGDPFCHVSRGVADLTEAARALGEFLVGLANDLADAYNELKAWAIEQVASTICPEAAAGACKTMIEVAVDALLTSVGVPPTMPNFDDLADIAKGELVDLAMDQLGVGSLCDAVSQAGTSKTCGELAVQLQNMDACSFAPKGQEDRCRDLVEDAVFVCDLATDDSRCELLTSNAQDLLEAGIEVAMDESVAAIEERVSRAALQSIGFAGPPQLPGYEHDCEWGGPNMDEVICPPYEPDSNFFTVDPPPAGCRIGTIGSEVGDVICSFPPREIVAIPEPLGQHQPIEVKVLLARNDNPLPDDFTCGPLSAVATTITPRGAAGRPYLPATAEFPADVSSIGLRGLTLWLSEPNPHVEIPDDRLPASTLDERVREALESAAGSVAEGVLPSGEWRQLLAAGSYVSISVSGDCITTAHGDGLYGIVGAIPDPQPRITPGAP